MNAYERQKEKIMKKLNHQQLQYSKAFQSQNSEISQGGEEEYLNRDDDAKYHYDEQKDQQSNNYGTSYNKTDQLRNSLIIIHQTNTLNYVFQYLNQKIFWLKFHSLKQILFCSPIQKPCLIQNQIRSNLLEKIFKYRSQRQIKQIAFLNFKQNKNLAQLLINSKTKFFIKYFIDASYTKLSFSFSAIRSFAESKTLVQKVQREKSQTKSKQNEEKLLKFEKQSRKFRAKSVFVLIRNFLNKKCIKISFNAIRWSLNQQQSQINHQITGSNQISNFQSKDARFIKKKIVPHKIIQEHSSKRQLTQNNLFNLNHIYFANYELKSINKNHLEFIRRISSFFIKKTMSQFNKFYQVLRLYSTKKQSLLNQDEKQIDRQNGDIEMIQNVMKSLCYLSSKISGRRKKQKDKYKRRHALLCFHQLIVNNEVQNLSAAFYSLKSHGLSQYFSIRSRIKKLQQQKQHYLKCFESSVLQIQCNYES